MAVIICGVGSPLGMPITSGVRSAVITFGLSEVERQVMRQYAAPQLSLRPRDDLMGFGLFVDVRDAGHKRIVKNCTAPISRMCGMRCTSSGPIWSSPFFKFTAQARAGALCFARNSIVHNSKNFWPRYRHAGSQLKLAPPRNTGAARLRALVTRSTQSRHGYVKPFLKRHRSDAVDAEPVVEAALRPSMSSVAVKSKEQRAQGVLFRSRGPYLRQRTLPINALRGHLAEYGVVLPSARASVARMVSACCEYQEGLPAPVFDMAQRLAKDIAALTDTVSEIDKVLKKDRQGVVRSAFLADNARRRTDYRCGHSGVLPRRQ